MKISQNTLFKSSGKIVYEENYCVKLLIEQNILDYYFKLIPKYFNANKPRWPAHITIVREKDKLETEIPSKPEFLGKYEGEYIDFCYYGNMRHEGRYFWLECYSVRLEQIRLELGLLAKSQITIPPKGFKKTFHSTIGNLK
jgi:hypothetical protein